MPRSADRIVLVLGAGASWASLFGPIATALFDGIGVTVAPARRWLMGPEALLTRLADRDVDIDSELRATLSGGSPNAVHCAAAQSLDRRSAVWTTNFDELVEAAAATLQVPGSPHRPGR